MPDTRPETRPESPERRSTPTPNVPPPVTVPPNTQQGQQKSGGGDTSDPMRERHHVDPGRDSKADYPKDPSR
ncbi:MAG TPA: hypothetical protein VFJ86_12875 [Usitatibacter sp.]|jgi:hypothetical protein|nr:hypothetical protein [Usitatibacter sp.]